MYLKWLFLTQRCCKLGEEPVVVVSASESLTGTTQQDVLAGFYGISAEMTTVLLVGKLTTKPLFLLAEATFSPIAKFSVWIATRKLNHTEETKHIGRHCPPDHITILKGVWQCLILKNLITIFH